MKKMISVMESGAVSLVMLLFCIAMTVEADSLKGFDRLFNLFIMLFVLYGLIVAVINNNKINKLTLLFTILFFLSRVISYKQNDLTITYGGAFMLQAFYFVGINRFIIKKTKSIKNILYTFLLFDVAAIAVCYYRYFFRHEKVVALAEQYAGEGLKHQTSLFQNPNYAGMMAGAAIVICCALIMNEKRNNKKVSVVLVPIMLINAVMLFVSTGCRSAQTGIVITAVIALIVKLNEKTDSVKSIIGVSLLVCSLSLIPLYSLVYWRDNNLYMADVSSLEKTLEAVSSERYAIWKSTILSTEGNELFGLGNNATAWRTRKERVYSSPAETTTENYYESTFHKRQHNGYLAVVNETGIAGAVSLLLLLLSRICNFKGRFRDGQWEKLLLIYIFWINLFEAKFVLHVFFTGFLMMVLLMPSEEEHNTQLEGAV